MVLAAGWDVVLPLLPCTTCRFPEPPWSRSLPLNLGRVSGFTLIPDP